MLTTCPYETRKICLVFTICMVGRWAKGSKLMKTVAFSTISIPPCQFHICRIRSVENKGHPKCGGGPCMVFRSLHSQCSQTQILKVG